MKKSKGKHIIPAVIECDLNTNESRVLKYIELTDEECDKQIIQPVTRIFYDIMKRNMESGRFDEIMKEYHKTKSK